ncbi:dynamin family protein [Sporosarcina sp. ACRSM]|uniref:dynamin family protein n=1 Tax=Sporosarcina sp. ACRSM TaxID=2918216 RepID=UPI001EF47AE3|nr:dynamin family protein [Sporosarcina sp. ACRSM]MCG7337155.1 dynamin family protein [Sporosarcina sp. ACRSM]
MKTVSVEKERYSDLIVESLQQLQGLFPESALIPLLEELKVDINNDYYTIVVVGEFKHGKSTLVNALLGEELMPMGAIPTTALIHAVFYGEKPELHIVKKDGEIEKRELTQDALVEYSAISEQDLLHINYVKVFLPADLLKNRVVLVDTPGLNDLNEHRTAVTKKIIPQADAVLFTLDARQPVNSSEYEFLKKMINEEGLKRIIFPANFMDHFDDEDELEDVKDYIERRIGNLTEGERPLVIPISAKKGMEGKTQKEPNLIAYSGLSELEKTVRVLLEDGNRQSEKMARNQFRVNVLLEAALKEANAAKAIYEADVEELENVMAAISSWMDNKSSWIDQLDDYIMERQKEIELIVEKSIVHFIEKLKKDINKRIAVYNGTDIDHLMNTEIPIAIQSGFEQWIDQYSIHIHELFSKLEHEISTGLSKSFEQNIVIKNIVRTELTMENTEDQVEVKSENTMLKAGLLVGGASTLALVMGASLIIPVMGMVALPFVQKKMMKQKLEQSKPALQQTMADHISALGKEFMENVFEYITTNISTIQTQTMEQFEAQLSIKKRLIDGQLTGKVRESSELDEKIREINKFETSLKQILEEVK